MFGPGPSSGEPGQEQRPVVYRFGKLPKDLPDGLSLSRAHEAIGDEAVRENDVDTEAPAAHADADVIAVPGGPRIWSPDSSSEPP